MGGGLHGGGQTAIHPRKICQMISWSPIYAATIYTHVGVEKIKAFAYMLHIGKRAYHAYMPYLQSARWVIATCLYGLDFFFYICVLGWAMLVGRLASTVAWWGKPVQNQVALKRGSARIYVVADPFGVVQLTCPLLRFVWALLRSRSFKGT